LGEGGFSASEFSRARHAFGMAGKSSDWRVLIASAACLPSPCDEDNHWMKVQLTPEGARMQAQRY